MLAVLSILVSLTLAGIFFCLLNLIKLKCIKKNNFAEPIKNKKRRRVLLYFLITSSIFFVLAISLFFFTSFY